MRKLFLYFIALFLFLAVTPAKALVGFVPNGGLWFSKTDLKPGETVTIYTVVINSEYASINGAVTFFDNTTPIATVPVKVERDQAVAVKTNWQPKDGQHGVYAKLSGSAMQKSDGPIIALPNTEIHSTIASLVPEQLDQQLADEVKVEVKSSSSSRMILPVNVPLMIAGEKIVASSTAATSTTNATTTSSPALTPEEIFAKNRELLNNASHIISSLSTTANNAQTAYEQGKGFVNRSQEYYSQAQSVWERVQPYVAQLAPIWDTISNHNEPIRVIIIVAVVLIIFAILRRL